MSTAKPSACHEQSTITQTTESTGSNSQAFAGIPKSDEERVERSEPGVEDPFPGHRGGHQRHDVRQEDGSLVETGEPRPRPVVDQRGEHERQRDGHERARRRR